MHNPCCKHETPNAHTLLSPAMLCRLAPFLLLSAFCLTASASATVVTATHGLGAEALGSRATAPLSAQTAILPLLHAEAASSSEALAPSPAPHLETPRSEAGIDPSPLALLGLGLVGLAVARRRTTKPQG